ncbi:MAG TPA: PaaI family thioesterase [Candidatus Limnocylindria bacterium]|nr:PaaI family thioesterase [Candidatus Limnocylindria bacterium]
MDPTEDRPRRLDPEGAFEFEPHHCFACGELNEHGLHLQLHTDPDGSWTELSLPSRFQGWDSVAHGGIVCTLLDEVMAWSVIGRGTWGVTARLSVAFKRPIRTGDAIRAEGWVVEQHRRACRTAGQVVDAATREVLATGEATFVAVPEAQLARLKTRYGVRRVVADQSPSPTNTTELVDAPATHAELAAPGVRG